MAKMGKNKKLEDPKSGSQEQFTRAFKKYSQEKELPEEKYGKEVTEYLNRKKPKTRGKIRRD